MKLGLLALAALGLAGVAWAAKYDSVVTITNSANWEIHQLYLSSTEEESWGPDQLGEQIIATGDSFKLHGVPCDEYDVKLVDEDGDECVVGGVSLCADSDAWNITDEDLLSCQVLTQE